MELRHKQPPVFTSLAVCIHCQTLRRASFTQDPIRFPRSDLEALLSGIKSDSLALTLVMMRASARVKPGDAITEHS